MKHIFKRRINRFCVWIKGIGPIPAATKEDDEPIFLTAIPKRIGDDCVIFVEGVRRMARLLKADNGSLWLVDIGAA